jgi:hypothetical protein
VLGLACVSVAILSLSPERGTTASSGFSCRALSCCAGVSFCSSVAAGSRYRAAGPLPPWMSCPWSTRLFSQYWRVRWGTPCRASAISLLRAPSGLCRTRSTIDSRSFSRRRCGMDPLIARLPYRAIKTLDRAIFKIIAQLQTGLRNINLRDSSNIARYTQPCSSRPTAILPVRRKPAPLTRNKM